MRFSNYIAGLGVVAAAVGCAGHSKPQRQPASTKSAITMTSPKDATPLGDRAFHVEVFQIEAPLGSFSQNEAFWKSIDEQCVDPATEDLLERNGIRVGVAKLSELENFTKFIDEALPADRLSVAMGERHDTRIVMQKDVPEQNIFYFDRTNATIGHTFDRSENVIDISFTPTPRRQDALRLTLCPVVRALHQKLTYSELNSELIFTYVNPEMLYDLKLRVDVPTDSFLIVSPSIDAQRATSVGEAFFLKKGAADQLENVLLIMPSHYQRKTNSGEPTVQR